MRRSVVVINCEFFVARHVQAVAGAGESFVLDVIASISCSLLTSHSFLLCCAYIAVVRLVWNVSFPDAKSFRVLYARLR